MKQLQQQMCYYTCKKTWFNILQFSLYLHVYSYIIGVSSTSDHESTTGQYIRHSLDWGAMVTHVPVLEHPQHLCPPRNTGKQYVLE